METMYKKHHTVTGDMNGKIIKVNAYKCVIFQLAMFDYRRVSEGIDSVTVYIYIGFQPLGNIIGV